MKYSTNIKVVIVLLFSFFISIETLGQEKDFKIMILPSDGLLNRMQSLTSFETEGVKNYKRDYQKAFVEHENSPELKSVIINLNSRFEILGYIKTQNLETTLREVSNKMAQNMAEGISEDFRTVMLAIETPDIVIEIDYAQKKTGMGNLLIYNLTATDAYSNKFISSISNDPNEPVENGAILVQQLSNSVERKYRDFNQKLYDYMDQLAIEGRVANFVIQKEEDVDMDMEMFEFDGEYLSDIVLSYVKKNVMNAKYRKGTMSESQIQFTEMRIPVKDEDGNPYDMGEWMKGLRRYLIKNGLPSDKYSLVASRSTLGSGRLIIKNK